MKLDFQDHLPDVRDYGDVSMFLTPVMRAISCMSKAKDRNAALLDFRTAMEAYPVSGIPQKESMVRAWTALAKQGSTSRQSPVGIGIWQFFAHPGRPSKYCSLLDGPGSLLHTLSTHHLADLQCQIIGTPACTKAEHNHQKKARRHAIPVLAGTVNNPSQPLRGLSFFLILKT